MNINDAELLTNTIRHTVGESPRTQVKEIRLLQEVGGGKLLVVTLEVETPDGYHELDVATTIDQNILRDDNSGLSNYFPIVVEAVKKKVSEYYDTTIEIEQWISRYAEQRNKPSVS